MKDPKDNLKPFKPGQSGNPGGRPKIEVELKKNKKLTKNVLKKVGDAFLLGDMNALVDLKLNGKPLERWLASIVIKGIETSDMQSLNTLLPWLIGKVREEVSVEMVVPTIIKYRSGEVEELGSKLIGEDEDEED